MDDKPADDKTADTAAQVASHAERMAKADEPDPFPPEGTDEKVLRSSTQRPELSEDARLKATKAALDRESRIPDNHVPHKEPFDL